MSANLHFLPKNVFPAKNDIISGDAILVTIGYNKFR